MSRAQRTSPSHLARAVQLAFIGAALAGCASGVQPRQPDMMLPPSYDATEQSAVPMEALDQWWQLYGDPQLTSLVQRALDSGLDARQAVARLQEAQANRAQALSRYAAQGDIQVGSDVTATRVTASGPDSERVRSTSVTLPVSWELDFFGRRDAARRAADADLLAARFDYEAARAALVAQVASTLFQARGLAARLEDGTESIRIQRELLDVLERRVEHGLAAPAETDRVAADVARTQAEVVALESELAAARRALLVLVGDGLASSTTLSVASQMLDAPSIPTAIPGELLTRRPDIREASARVQSAAGNVRLAELDFFPQLTLQPARGLSWGGAADVASTFWTLGVGVTVPVLDRPRLNAALNVQSARGQQAVIAYEQVVQNAFAEVDQALTRLGADRQRVTLLVDGELRARRAHQASLIRFQRGLGDLQSVLDAEIAWRATRTALTSARLDALEHSVQSFKALGGGWPATRALFPTSSNP